MSVALLSKGAQQLANIFFQAFDFAQAGQKFGHHLPFIDENAQVAFRLRES